MSSDLTKATILEVINTYDLKTTSLIVITDDKIIWYNKQLFITANKVLILYENEIIYATKGYNDIIYVYTSNSTLYEILECYDVFDNYIIELYEIYDEHVPNFMALWLYFNYKYYNEFDISIPYNISTLFEEYIKDFEKIIYVLC